MPITIRIAAALVLVSGSSVLAEPQGGFPAQRERATQAQTQQRADEAGARAMDEVQRRQAEMDRRDAAIMRSICRGC